MAERLEQLPPKLKAARVQHPWDEWLDGSAWLIRQGSDFPGKVNSMRVRLYGKARECGKVIDVRSDEAAGTIAFQVTGDREDKVTG